ncbi:MAG: winged helix-turn-helix domain-containing protein [Thiofilum sp.]|uniref:winged helix-turn-helix domain-containing protein n=1 Tax=Thiofilum sp. TaxID=2212733 RepID=UPI0025D52382|nr:winged helix-turn-helix domain-containing protein [Thiofilum sp.]MBK8455436.1 winged helix-turn-helix domain-containing protein [Thiofilum sp.]
MGGSKCRLGQFSYDLINQQLLDRTGTPCALRYQSAQVLHYLAINANKSVSKRELFAVVWRDVIVTDDSLVQCIAEIRRLLQDREHSILKTIPRVGYLLVTMPDTEYITYIPEDLLPFLGRTQELQQLESIIANPSCRLMTITGIAGIGKTRLAKKLARQCAQYFPQGVYFVELAAISVAELIPVAIAKVMSIPLQGRLSPLEQLQLALADQSILIVLDNMEQFVPDLSSCQALLEHNKKLKLLTTSRIPLGLYGEWVYPLRGLLVPNAQQTLINCTAIELFIQTAKRVKYDFEPNATEQLIILEICRLLQGTPLGIEIVAGWIKNLTCEELLIELRAYLHATDTSLLQEQDTFPLDTILQQSWQMLSQHEQSIMQLLALFRGKFSRHAAQAITNTSWADYNSLIDKSMLSRDKSGYYTLHEVMRHYANHYRVNHNNEVNMIKHFIEYHINLANQTDAMILGGQQLIYIQQLEQEHDNFRECLNLCSNNKTGLFKQSIEWGLDLVGALGTFWFLANHWREGYQFAQQFLQLTSSPIVSLAHVRALFTAGGIAVVTDNYKVAEHNLPLSIDMALSMKSNSQAARGLTALGVLRRLQQRYDDAINVGQQGMALFTETEHIAGYQFNLANVGHSLLCLGHYEEGVKALEHCIRLNQEFGVTISLPYVLVNLGRLHSQLKQFATARAYLRQATQVTDQLNILLYRAQSLCLLGWIEIQEGELLQALVCFKASFADYIHLGDREGQIEVMNGIGVAKQLLGDNKRAWQFIVVANDLKKQAGIKNLSDNESLIVKAKQELGRCLNKNDMRLYQNLARSNDLEGLSKFI